MGILEILEQFKNMYGGIVEAGICPVCGGTLYKWATPTKNCKRDGLVCPRCKYIQHATEQQKRDEEIYIQKQKEKQLNYMKRNSIVNDNITLNYTLETYKNDNRESEQAKINAKFWLEALEKSPVHIVLTGGTGVGKTHLAVAIANEYLKRSDYTKKVIVINYRELLEQLKIGFNDPKVYKELQGYLMQEVKKADFVVIDDLGAELGAIENRATPTQYNLDTLQSIVEARLNKATLFTSNFNSKELRLTYGERIFSRIVNNSSYKGQLLAFRFVKTQDRRVKIDF